MRLICSLCGICLTLCQCTGLIMYLECVHCHRAIDTMPFGCNVQSAGIVERCVSTSCVCIVCSRDTVEVLTRSSCISALTTSASYCGRSGDQCHDYSVPPILYPSDGLD